MRRPRGRYPKGASPSVLCCVGKIPKEGGGLKALCEDIKNGETDKRKLFDTYGDAYIRVYKGIDHAITLSKKPKKFERTPKIPVTVWFGESGHGKTYDAEQQIIDMDGSVCQPKIKQIKNDWYDGWEQQDVFMLDDFRGSVMKPEDFIHLVDNKDPRVPVKGGYVPFNPKHIFITAPYHPINWWPKHFTDNNNWIMIKRRIDKIYHVVDQVVTDVTEEPADEFKRIEETLYVK